MSLVDRLGAVKYQIMCLNKWYLQGRDQRKNTLVVVQSTNLKIYIDLQLNKILHPAQRAHWWTHSNYSVPMLNMNWFTSIKLTFWEKFQQFQLVRDQLCLQQMQRSEIGWFMAHKNISTENKWKREKWKFLIRKRRDCS